MQLNPYLYFNGTCEEAFKFYEKCLGGKIEAMMTHAGTPMESHTPPEWRNKILHARLSVDGTILMASDAPPGRFSPQQGFSVSLSMKDPAEGERVFNALARGRKSQYALPENFLGRRFRHGDGPIWHPLDDQLRIDGSRESALSRGRGNRKFFVRAGAQRLPLAESAISEPWSFQVPNR